MIHLENGIIELKGSTFQIGKDLNDLMKIINRHEDIKDGYEIAKKADKVTVSILEDLLK